MTSPTTATAIRLRYVTAAALFDGHDASINIIRRLLQNAGAEVIHLGHNRSVPEVVAAALQEDADAVAVSSYQGGHVEYFKFLRDELDAHGLRHVAIFGGGGGVIIPSEMEELHAYGIGRIYSPDDGRQLGLTGIIADMQERTRQAWRERTAVAAWPGADVVAEDAAFARALTLAEMGQSPPAAGGAERPAPVLGVTGTGGAGKSSLTDELVRRYLLAHPDHSVCLLAVDPSKRKSGGALLGDRIRMNAIYAPRCFLRSFATRGARGELSAAVGAAITLARARGFDLIIVETSGIGQGDSAIAEVSDVACYVMTSEYGAASQLEKIDMLDFADLVVINKYDRPGAEDALRDVRKQYRRSRNLFTVPDEALPIFGTVASKYNDSGVNALYAFLDPILEAVREGKRAAESIGGAGAGPRVTVDLKAIIPPSRVRYLSEIADCVRAHAAAAARDAARVRCCQALASALDALEGDGGEAAAAAALRGRLDAARAEAGAQALAEVAAWDDLVARYRRDEAVVQVRGREHRYSTFHLTLAGSRVPKVVLPRLTDAGDRLLFLRRENVPGAFPFTAGVFPFKRLDEDPKRQFAGEGSPQRTNQRFHYLSRDDAAKRLSTAFDSLTLYGEDPAPRPDIFGKIGEGGVSICTLDDMRALYAGFDLCHPNTSVSMTINGPAPIILAMFFVAATDQQLAEREAAAGRPLTAEERAEAEAWTLRNLRGTVQADILKEDQAQNTCIFSTEFALRLMGDVQEFFTEHGVRNYYSVSISGYHIAEAGANPITQLALTLANGFTYVEYYLARGLAIDDFAPNLSFFFSNGLDAEYTVIGRVARRIWAIAMRDRYGGDERSQKLKYHIQTSGRSLHAQEVDFNDIRTTLQALMAVYDNCNSLHTNSYDEAITTPSEESVRRAMAIQLIIARELGWAKCENPLQGSALIAELTDLVEEAVLAEFDRLSRRGGVLGAMETQYQRGKIQEESLIYEHRKHSGELPIVGVNTFIKERDAAETVAALQLARCTREEKEARLRELAAFQQRHAAEAPAALRRLQETALNGGNVFAELLRTVRHCSLGQITRALYEVGGQYRRAM